VTILSTLRQRRLIKVFIASPGDLMPERLSAHEVVNEINSSFGRTFDVAIDLLGWEDIRPGVGRPQAIINRDDCDLFVGLLWKRWGMSPGGEFSSGFEEEFERARQRNQRTGQPEIWLAFKQVDPSLLADPGDQLKSVLAFKQAQIAARTVFYKEFNDERDWATQLRNWLMTHIGQLIKDELEVLRHPPQTERSMPPEVAEGTSPASIGNSSSSVSNADSTSSIIPPQLKEVATTFSQAVNSNDDSAFFKIMNSLDQFQILRMFFNSKAWLSNITHELLSIHEINLLYIDRDRLEIIIPEYEIIMRTIIGDRFSLAAGWYWFSDLEFPDIAAYLYGKAVSDPLPEVRAHAINLLNDLSLYPPEDKALGFAKSIINDRDENVAKAALEYLGNLANPALLPLLNEKASHSGPSGRSARTAALQLETIVDPAAAFIKMSSNPNPVNAEILRLLEQHIAHIPSAMLVAAIENSNSDLRVLATRTLMERHELSEDQATRLLPDESVRVRQIALEALIQQGMSLSPEDISQYLKTTTTAENQPLTLASLSPFSSKEFVDPEIVIQALFETYSEENLKQEISWFKLYGPVAYRILAKNYFTTNRDRIFHDFSTNFKGLRQKSIDQLKTKIISDHSLTADQEIKVSLNLERFIVDKFVKNDEYVLNEYVASALAGIALYEDSIDVSAIRQLLAKNDIAYNQKHLSLQAIKCLRRFGSATDVSLAIQIAKTSYGEVRNDALKAAIALAPITIEVVTELVKSDEVDLVRAGVGAVWYQDPDIVKALLFPLLQHSKTEVRTLAIAYFIMRYPKERIKDILGEYLELPTYYYNVVCWFDRALYCPTELSVGYIKRLQKEIGDLDSWHTAQNAR
jgi:hypothetical protein